MGQGDTQDCGSVQADAAGTRARSKPPRVGGNARGKWPEPRSGHLLGLGSHVGSQGLVLGL